MVGSGQGQHKGTTGEGTPGGGRGQGRAAAVVWGWDYRLWRASFGGLSSNLQWPGGTLVSLLHWLGSESMRGPQARSGSSQV